MPTADRPYRQLLGVGTTRRFLLLLLVLIAACLYVLNTIALGHRSGAAYLSCMRAIGAVPYAYDLDNTVLLTRNQEAIDACRSHILAACSFEALLGTALVLLVAFALYLCLPAWRRHRRRLLPLRADSVKRLRLEDMVHRAGLGRMPEFVEDPGALTASATVIGRMGRYTVCLNAGLLRSRRLSFAQFEAVVLHELAHIRNRDVDITYATVALWRAFAALVLTSYLAYRGWLLMDGVRWFWPGYGSGLPEVAVVAWLAVHVRLARADVLHSREQCADADAVAWAADPAVWHAAELAERQQGRPVRRWFGRLWHNHPSWAKRARTIDLLGRPVVYHHGGEGLQGLMFISTMLALVVCLKGISGMWPPLLTALGCLSAAALFLSAGAVIPSKRPMVVDAWSRPAVMGPRVGTILAICVASLSGFAAVHTGTRQTSDDAPLPVVRDAPLLAAHLRQLPPPLPPSQIPPARHRAIHAWFRNDGDNARRALNSAVQGILKETGKARIRPPELADACQETRQTVINGKALPAFPDPQGQRIWSTMLSSVAAGDKVLCQPDTDLHRLLTVWDARAHYTDAAAACLYFYARYVLTQPSVATPDVDAPPRPT